MSWDGRIKADARQLPIASASVQCVVTSPPYWGLRDYGNPGQIGLERTPEEYVASMLEVFREVWRVLKADGVLWLNLGDSYCSTAPGTMGDKLNQRGILAGVSDRRAEGSRKPRPETPAGLKPKDLVGIPWRVAFELQADGWYLRSDVIWAKPNPMPESVTDRPTKAHEYIFLLTKSERYFYDFEAIRETAVKTGTIAHLAGGSGERAGSRAGLRRDEWMARKRVQEPDFQPLTESEVSGHRNKRSVWAIATSPYPEAHYATFPEEIPEICIKAGSRPGDLILDPFFGSGTVGRVAERLSRRWIGVDLGYQDLQAKRVKNVQRELLESRP